MARRPGRAAMRHRGYGRAVLPSRSGPPTVSGRWSLLPPREPDQTRRLHALALTLLDRHGIVTRGATGSERVSGGFGALYPVLRAMEESGQCRRGYFVEGLGAAQFALTGAVDRMRALADALPADQDAGPPAAAPGLGGRGPGGRERRHLEVGGHQPGRLELASRDRGRRRPGGGRSERIRTPADGATADIWMRGPAAEPPSRPARPMIVLAAADPANAYGAALPWPARPDETPGGHRPGRKAGALVVLADGELVLYVERGGKTLLSWTSDPALLDPAAAALAAAVRAGALGRLTVERADGSTVYDSPLARALESAGFRPTPRGLRLRG